MGWLDSFFDPGEAYAKGQEQLDKYYDKAQTALQPYNQFGQDTYGTLSGAMKQLLNPADLEAQWTKGYAESPSAIQAEKMAQERGLNAASSLGLNGSNTALRALQGGTSQIGLGDRQNYLNDLMQKYMAGTGIAGNIFNTGASAATGMSNNAMNMGNNSAQMAYGEQAAPGALMGRLLGGGLGFLSGGPLGGLVGSNIGGGTSGIGQGGGAMRSWSLGG